MPPTTSRPRRGFTLLEILLVIALLVTIVVFAVLIRNINDNIAAIDNKGRELTKWAATTATWTTELRTKHLATLLAADHTAWKVAPDHVRPPPDPPPIW
jgi:prepilin-type N-terminal cleavage/methylation domain-containing protein